MIKRAGSIVQDLQTSDASYFKNWLSGDLRKARIHARLRTDREKHYDQLLSALNYLKDSFAEKGVDISWSGFALLYKEMERRMVKELVFLQSVGSS